jgi:hypothetical protein
MSAVYCLGSRLIFLRVRCIHSSINSHIRVQEVVDHAAEQWYVRRRASPHDQTADPHHRGDPRPALCFGERASGLGPRVFAMTFISQMASLPSLVHGFHGHIEPVRHASRRCYFFSFPAVLKRSHFCVLPFSDETSPFIGTHVAQLLTH